MGDEGKQKSSGKRQIPESYLEDILTAMYASRDAVAPEMSPTRLIPEPILHDVGRELGLSPERVSQIIDGVIVSNSKKPELEDLLGRNRRAFAKSLLGLRSTVDDHFDGQLKMTTSWCKWGNSGVYVWLEGVVSSSRKDKVYSYQFGFHKDWRVLIVVASMIMREGGCWWSDRINLFSMRVSVSPLKMGGVSRAPNFLERLRLRFFPAKPRQAEDVKDLDDLSIQFINDHCVDFSTFELQDWLTSYSCFGLHGYLLKLARENSVKAQHCGVALELLCPTVKAAVLSAYDVPVEFMKKMSPEGG